MNAEANILEEPDVTTQSVHKWKDPDRRRKGNIEHIPVCSCTARCITLLSPSSSLATIKLPRKGELSTSFRCLLLPCPHPLDNKLRPLRLMTRSYRSNAYRLDGSPPIWETRTAVQLHHTW